MITVIRLAGLALLSLLSSTALAAYTPKGPIEQKYMADGPWAVTYTTTSVACDREGNLCDITVHPTLCSERYRGVSQSSMTVS